MQAYSIVAERIPEDRLVIDCRKPAMLCRYSSARWLERALQFGEFRLCPAADYKDFLEDAARQDDELVRVASTDAKHVRITLATGQTIAPIGAVTYRSEIRSNYLVLCFSTAYDDRLFDEFSGTDACLVIHRVDAFCERLHAAAELQLPRWVGMDGAIAYGSRSPLGAAFSKPLQFVQQHEWRFAWLPERPGTATVPTLLTIGNIEDLAELRSKP